MEDPSFDRLTSSRLLIRRFTPADAEALASYRSDAAVARYQDWECPFPVEEARLFIAGLHPATGGTGAELCSGDMLLEALVACAGVTLKAVATALEIPLRNGTVKAEGDLDFRGTLGVDKETPVGFQRIRLTFALATDATDDQLATLIRLTERYCVVFQTLRSSPQLTVARTSM